MGDLSPVHPSPWRPAAGDDLLSVWDLSVESGDAAEPIACALLASLLQLLRNF